MSLLARDLLTEITVHIDTEMDRALYISRDALTAEQAGRVVEHMLLATMDLARQWNITLSPTAVMHMMIQGGHRDG